MAMVLYSVHIHVFVLEYCIAGLFRVAKILCFRKKSDFVRLIFILTYMYMVKDHAHLVYLPGPPNSSKACSCAPSRAH